MSIRQKIAAGFAALFVLLAVPAAYSIIGGLRIQDNANGLQKEIYPALDLTKQMIDTHRQTKESLLAAISELDDEAIEEAGALTDKFHRQVSMLKTIKDDRELEDIGRLYKEYSEKGLLIAKKLVDGSDMTDVMDEVVSLNDTANKLKTMLQDYYDLNYRAFVSNVQEVYNLSSKFVSFALGGVLLSFVLGAVIAYIISTRITKGINVVVERIEDIARGEGDLTKRLELTTNDEMGLLATGFNNFVGNLRGIIAKVVSFTTDVASASMQYSATCEEIRDRIELQMGKAGQVATATEQMNATIADMARNCTSAAQMAKEADMTATKGNEVIARTIDGIHGIATKVQESTQLILLLNNRSDEIGKIIEVIDDIADQTNLLALNAAIEAARAGEQGRGFAVVADEVRKLSERTISATKEIGDMIKTIQEETHRAVGSMKACNSEGEVQIKLAGEAGEVLKEIVSKVQQVNEMIQRIVVATDEQSAASEHIEKDMEDLVASLKETSGSTEQMTMASKNLAEVSVQLQDLVSKFKVTEGSEEPRSNHSHKVENAAADDEEAPKAAAS